LTVAIRLVVLIGVALRGQTQEACERGLADFHAGRIAEAQAGLWECVESARGTETHSLYLAQTYRGLKNYESGLTRADVALQHKPDSLDLLYLASYLRYRSNQTKNSMALASKAYKLAPDDWRIHQVFALNYISFNMLEEAKLSLLQALRLKPDNAELHYQLARLYFTQGAFVNSIKASKQAIDIFPDYLEAHHNLALSYEGNGDVDLAIASFQKAVDLNRKYKRQDELPLIDFAVYQRMRGAPEAALPLLEEALLINPRSSKANYEMGELLRNTRQYREAKRYLEVAHDLDPCNARVIYGLAMVTRILGDAPRATALLKRFKEVNTAEKCIASK
jgi:tetratricopeptide (TPR) repeat protein